MKTKTILFTLSFLLSFNLFAQKRYRIKYDYSNDKIEYFNITDGEEKSISKAKFKRNSIVEVVVINVNPFAVKTKDSLTEINYSPKAGFNMKDFLGSARTETDFSEAKKMLGNTTSIDDRGNKVAGENLNLKAFNESIEYFNNSSDIFQEFMGQLESPKVKENDIKEELKNIISNKFKDHSNITTSNILQTLRKIESELKDKKQKNHKQIIKNITTLRSSYSREKIDELLTKMDAGFDNAISNINRTTAIYKLIKQQKVSFEQKFEFEVKNDKTIINLNFELQNYFDEDDISNGKRLSNKKIAVVAKGGHKVNTSIALTFTNFGEKNNDYFVNGTGKIYEEVNDYYAPSLATMINYYPFYSGAIRPGVSFGVAVPVVEKITSINYLFGGTITFGDADRFSISGGWSYSPTKVLKSPLKVEDSSGTFGSDITRDIYSFGYYFGISFSLFSLTK